MLGKSGKRIGDGQANGPTTTSDGMVKGFAFGLAFELGDPGF
jgi:hypothetical protein